MPNPEIDHVEIKGTTYDVAGSGSGSGMFKVTFTLTEDDGEYTVTCDQTFADITGAIEDGQFIDAILIDERGNSVSLVGYSTWRDDGDVVEAVFYTSTGVIVGIGEEDGDEYIYFDQTYYMQTLQYCDEFGNIIESKYVTYPYIAFCNGDSWTQTKNAVNHRWTATPNSFVYVLLRDTNQYNGQLYLNINETGSKPIYINGTISSSSNKTLPAGSYLVFYDGTNYYFRTDGKLPATTEKAVADGSGNVITTTYATKSELPTTVSSLTNDAGYITFGDIPVGAVYETTSTADPSLSLGGSWQLLGQYVTDDDTELTTSEGLLFADGAVSIIQTYKWEHKGA